MSFLGQMEQEIGQLALRQAVDQIGRGSVEARIQSHVQRGRTLERKAVLRIEKLIGADPQIGKDSIDLAEAGFGGAGFQFGKVGMKQTGAAGERLWAVIWGPHN